MRSYSLEEAVKLYSKPLENGCIAWTGNITSGGYARYKQQRIHKVLYELKNGKVPDDHVLHHKCNNKGCINIDHLEPVPADNHPGSCVDGHKDATHCPQGHEYNSTNTRYYQHKNGSVSRSCRTCHKINERGRRRSLRGYRPFDL